MAHFGGPWGTVKPHIKGGIMHTYLTVEIVLLALAMVTAIAVGVTLTVRDHRARRDNEEKVSS